MKKASFCILGAVCLAANAFAAKIGNSSVNVNGYLDSSYEFNFNRPLVSTNLNTNPQNNYRVYDRGHNQFQINQARVGLSHESENVAMDVQFGTGTQMDVLNASDTGTLANLRKAEITWKKNSFSLTGGRFDADFGFERIDTVDNWNYSRSYLFNGLNPKIYNGLKLDYHFSHEWMGDITFANGADRTNDNNRAKTADLGLTYKHEATTIKGGYEIGAEQATGDLMWEHTIDLTVKHALTKEFSLGAEAAYKIMKQADVGPVVGANKATARQTGLAVYGTMNCCPDHWTTVRFEYLRDGDGAFTFLTQSSHLWELTLTHRYNMTSNLGLWAEARYDGSNRTAFFGTSGTKEKHSQVTAILGATFNI